MDVTRTFDLLDRYRDNQKKEDALCFKQDGAWVKYSSDEYIELSYNRCYGLYELGLRKGDKVVTVASNRPEWNIAHMGMSMMGIVHVPVFSSLNISEYEYIIKNCGAKTVLVSDSKLLRCTAPAVDAAGTSADVIISKGKKLTGIKREFHIY
jgi:long-chain acyl-CoA synthetase